MEQATYRPLTAEEEKKIPAPTEPWADSRALAIAVQNQNEMENFLRTGGHVRRWQVSDEMYHAWSPQKTWPGTRVPRASVGVYLTFEQVESLLPAVLGAMFPLRDNLDVAPRPGSTADEARAAFELLMYQFDALGEDGMLRLREIARRAFKSAFLYGNGIIEVGWLQKLLEVLRYEGVDVPVRRNVPDPYTGILQSVPTGEFRRIIQQRKYQQYLSQPDIKNIAIRDFFVDPNCPTPNVQDARFASARALTTVDELRSYRGRDGFSIPPDSVLVDLAKTSKTGQFQDQMKQTAEVYRQGFWMPQNDYSADPGSFRMELLRYYTRERCVWVLNRNQVIYNRPNSFGFIPFIDAFYADVLGRFYGTSLSDLLEGEQRTQQSILQARLDELALSIHAPLLKRRGINISSSAVRIAPGKVIEVGDDPAKDLVKMEWPGVTQQAPMEVEASERRAQKITGITDLVALGAPSTGGNSANRTATGINTQAAATGKRIQYLVENLETTFIEPLCNMVLQLNQQFLPQGKVIEVLGEDGQFFKLDPLNILNANVKFSMRASDKLKSRMMLMQALPLLLPMYLNPSFVQQMAQQQGKTIDLKAIDRLVCDTLQIPPMSLWRDQSGDEVQMMMMQQMAPQMMQQQMQDDRLQKMHDMQEDKGDTELAKTMAGKMLMPESVAGLLAENGLPGVKEMMDKKNAPKPVAKKKK